MDNAAAHAAHAQRHSQRLHNASAPAVAAAPHVGTLLETDTKDTNYYVLRQRSSIDELFKGYKFNNKNAFVHYTETQLANVCACCVTLRA